MLFDKSFYFKIKWNRSSEKFTLTALGDFLFHSISSFENGLRVFQSILELLLAGESFTVFGFGVSCSCNFSSVGVVLKRLKKNVHFSRNITSHILVLNGIFGWVQAYFLPHRTSIFQVYLSCANCIALLVRICIFGVFVILIMHLPSFLKCKVSRYRHLCWGGKGHTFLIIYLYSVLRTDSNLFLNSQEWISTYLLRNKISIIWCCKLTIGLNTCKKLRKE